MSTNGDELAIQHTSSDLYSQRLRFARRAGLQFEGRRDVYKSAGYLTDEELTFDHYWSRYERQDIAGRIVDMPAMTTWKDPPTVIREGEGEGSEFQAAFEGLADRLSLWNRLERVDRLAGVGRFGVLLIGQAGDDFELRDELAPMQGPDDVIYLSVFHEGSAEINKLVTDPLDPRYNLPETYNIDFSTEIGATGGSTSATKLVHWSRVIHVAEDLLENDVFGRPRLKRVLNRLMDLEKITAATGEAFWQLADQVLVSKLDKDVSIEGDDLTDYREALEDIYHDLRRQIVLKGGELEWVGGSTPDPENAADLCMSLIAAASGIPKRILFGSETGERASTQDERQWLGNIAERQQRFAEPMILRALIDRLQEYGALPPVSAYDVQWPPLFELDEVELADVRLKTAQTAKELAGLGGVPRDHVEVTEGGDVRLKTDEELEADPPEEREPPMPRIPEEDAMEDAA